SPARLSGKAQLPLHHLDVSDLKTGSCVQQVVAGCGTERKLILCRLDQLIKLATHPMRRAEAHRGRQPPEDAFLRELGERHAWVGKSDRKIVTPRGHDRLDRGQLTWEWGGCAGYRCIGNRRPNSSNSLFSSAHLYLGLVELPDDRQGRRIEQAQVRPH